uniref:Formin-C n=1 Tax=Dictyostelium discoideum TaxID=44689 RepID=UPI00021DE055|nr:Chain A, Formin-C [Dictyostelium discoideum]
GAHMGGSMKIRVELINGNEHRTSSTPQQPQQNPSVSHIFDGETAVKDHIKVLLTHFKIPVDKVSSYALQNPFTLAYVEDSFLTPERLVEAEKSYFILRMKPHAIADR